MGSWSSSCNLNLCVSVGWENASSPRHQLQSSPACIKVLFRKSLQMSHRRVQRGGVQLQISREKKKKKDRVLAPTRVKFGLPDLGQWGRPRSPGTFLEIKIEAPENKNWVRSRENGMTVALGNSLVHAAIPGNRIGNDELQSWLGVRETTAKGHAIGELPVNEPCPSPGSLGVTSRKFLVVC